MSPEVKQHGLVVDDGWNGADHAEPDPGEIPQVEYVVELGGRRHHLRLGHVPHHSRDRDQFFGQKTNVFRETAPATKTRKLFYKCSAQLCK